MQVHTHLWMPLVLLASLCASVCGDVVPNDLTILQVPQKVDHFNYNRANRYFNQRVVLYKNFWGGNNYPIFFYAGNEGNVFSFVNNTGFMWETAPLVGAMVIFAEHRYYGTSFPTNATRTDNPYLYLSVEQALADFAYLIEYFRQKGVFSESSPVITFGGSYGGMLASWFRQKYPHLTAGALAGSAPVAQFLGHYECGAFNTLVTQDYEGYGKNCAEGIRNSWKAIRRLHSSNPTQLRNIFKLCSNFERMSVDYFINTITDVLTNVAMTDYPNPADFLKPLPAYPMKEMCAQITDPYVDDVALLSQLSNALNVYFNYTGSVSCIDISGDPTDLGAKAWNVQYCTELFLPICAKGGKSDFFEPSPLNLTSFELGCKRSYFVTPDYYKAEQLFGIGSKQVASTSRIIFSNGERDPWSTGGILKLPGQKVFRHGKYFVMDYRRFPELKGNIHIAGNQIILLRIPNACHHEDLRQTGDQDPSVLIAARLVELKIITSWIHEDYVRQNKMPAGWITRFDQIMRL